MSKVLRLFWKDENGENYNIGELSVEGNKYYFQYNGVEVRKALNEGFILLEGFPMINSKYFREELFKLFRGWIGEVSDKEEDMLQNLKNLANDKFYFLGEEHIS
ncbi:hypothetical protein [Clostridium tunisiense]|uniref:hypothetical protein n=1 Tax=Clostridium tunisiense TaxID=219748 RepID=UPI00031E4DFF|nr:hypothetical protein [Clostridium tunisiense]